MTVPVPLTEQDRADIQADLRVWRAELEKHEDTEPLPHMIREHQETTKMFQREIDRLEAQLVDG